MMPFFLYATAAFVTLIAAQSDQSTTIAPTSTTAAPTSKTTSVSALTTNAAGVISPAYALEGYDDCTADQRTAIDNGFTDGVHILLADQLTGKYPSIDWDSAVAQDYWGSYERNNQFRSDIVANLNRAASVRFQFWLNPFAPRLHVRCDDPKHECDCVGNNPGDVDAYNINGDAHINFCPAYFTRRDLAAVLVYQPNGLWEFMSEYHNKGVVWVHELMHIRDIGIPANALDRAVIDQPLRNYPGVPFNPNDPSSWEAAYGTKPTKWLAQSDTVPFTDAVDNADNYALFALAYYLQKNLGFYPHLEQASIDPPPGKGLRGLVYQPAANSTSGASQNSSLYCYSHLDTT